MMKLGYAKIFLTAALVTGTITGCGTFQHADRADKLKLSSVSPGNGIVIISTGAPDKCISASSQLILIRSGGTGEKGHVGTLEVDNYSVKSEFTTHHGYIHVFQIYPGEYYFFPRVNNPMLRAVKASKADFTVAPGEILYLGEYFLKQGCGRNTSAIFQDSFERDYKALKILNGDLAASKIEKRILRATGEALNY